MRDFGNGLLSLCPLVTQSTRRRAPLSGICSRAPFGRMNNHDTTPASDRLLVGLASAPLQQRLKLGVCKFLDRFPSWCAPGADPVIRKDLTDPLRGEFGLIIHDFAALKRPVPRLGPSLVHSVQLFSVFGARVVLPGCAEFAVFG